MPTFTSSREDRAFEQLMKRVPNFEPDPPETAVIQWHLDRQNRKKERRMKTSFHPSQVSLPAISERRDLADAKPQNIAPTAKGK